MTSSAGPAPRATDEVLGALAERWGTPLYVYDLDSIRAQHRLLAQALPQPHHLLYSVKANPHPLVLATLRSLGCGAEVSSRGELDAARQAGFRSTELLCTGPGKSVEEIRHALATGHTRFSVESGADLERIGRLAAEVGAVARCLIRIHQAGAPGRAGLRMTGRPSPFGWDQRTVGRWVDHAPHGHARVVGLHFYAATNVADDEALLETLEGSLAAAVALRDAYGIPLDRLDLGGGFAAPFGSEGASVPLDALCRLEGSLDRALPGWRAGAPEVLFESGRFLTAASGTLVTRVIDVKESSDRAFVVCDAGINHLGGLTGLGRIGPAPIVPRSLGAPAADQAPVTVTGPLCTPADVLAREVALPRPGIGDLLAIPNVGAYGLTASLLGFLSHPVAGEVVVDGPAVVDASRIELRRTRIEGVGGVDGG